MVMWDAHHQALAAAVLLEGHIERLSCSISHGCSGSHRCLGSDQWSQCQGHSRSGTRHLLASPQAWIPQAEGHTWDAAKRQAPSTSPVQPRRQVTFEESSLDSEATPKTVDWSQPTEADDSLPPSWAPETADWSQPKEEDLGGPSILDPQVAEFLSGENLEDDPGLQECLPKPSFDNALNWVAWQVEQVAMPTWWPDLASILGQRDICQLA